MSYSESGIWQTDPRQKIVAKLHRYKSAQISERKPGMASSASLKGDWNISEAFVYPLRMMEDLPALRKEGLQEETKRPPQINLEDTVIATADAAPIKIGEKKRNRPLVVNMRRYETLDCVGRGGSARVYRMMTGDCEIVALKKISLRKIDGIGAQGFKSEIELLRRLAATDRVIRLIDWEYDNTRDNLSMVRTDLHR